MGQITTKTTKIHGREFMPSVSQSQHKFMEAVASGSVKKKGLSPEKAKEWASQDKGWKKLVRKQPNDPHNQ